MAPAGSCDNVRHKLLEIYAAAAECIMALMSLREPLFLMLVAVVQFAIFAATASKNIRQDGSEMHAEGNGKLPAKSPCLHVPETECVP